jgi:hypothetical protein
LTVPEIVPTFWAMATRLSASIDKMAHDAAREARPPNGAFMF